MKHIKVLYIRHNYKRLRLIQLLSRRYEVSLHCVEDILEKAGHLRYVPPPPTDLFFFQRHPYWHYFTSKRFRQPDCLSVFTTWENVKPDFRFFDYAFSFEPTDDRNFQLPNFAYGRHFEELRSGRYDAEIRSFRETPKDEFCNFIHRFTKNAQRKTIVKKLSAYKKVDCPGQALNNVPPIGPSVKDKLHFMKRHKFTIAFENTSAANYVTEKIYHALLVNSVPIYWGCPKVAEYFNPEAFINCHDYDSLDRVVDRVIEVDNDDELYRRYAEAPAVLEGSKVYAITEEAIMQRLEKIVNGIGTVRPVATTFAYRHRLLLWITLYRIREPIYRVRMCLAYNLFPYIRSRLLRLKRLFRSEKP